VSHKEIKLVSPDVQSVLVESGEFSKEATSTSLQLREFIIGDGLTWAGSA